MSHIDTGISYKVAGISPRESSILWL